VSLALLAADKRSLIWGVAAREALAVKVNVVRKEARVIVKANV